MCVNYVYYYPKIELEVCKSSISYQTLFTYFRYMNEWVVFVDRFNQNKTSLTIKAINRVNKKTETKDDNNWRVLS